MTARSGSGDAPQRREEGRCITGRGRDLDTARCTPQRRPGPVPACVHHDHHTSRWTAYTEVILDLVRREQPTLRQLLARLAGARGHHTFAGTPEQVADLMEDWCNDGAADGFNVMPPVLPAMLELFRADRKCTRPFVPPTRERAPQRPPPAATPRAAR